MLAATGSSWISGGDRNLCTWYFDEEGMGLYSHRQEHSPQLSPVYSGLKASSRPSADNMKGSRTSAQAIRTFLDALGPIDNPS